MQAVDAGDVRVVERGEHARLAPEPGERDDVRLNEVLHGDDVGDLRRQAEDRVGGDLATGAHRDVVHHDGQVGRRGEIRIAQPAPLRDTHHGRLAAIPVDDSGEVYQARSRLTLIGEVQREHGQRALDELIRGLDLEQDPEGNFKIYVSNQSFEISPVDIQVSIDGEVVGGRDKEVDPDKEEGLVVVGARGMGEEWGLIPSSRRTGTCSISSWPIETQSIAR